MRFFFMIAAVGVLGVASAEERAAGIDLKATVSSILASDPRVKAVSEHPQGVVVKGRASGPEAVAHCIHPLLGLMWTPRGLGRLVQRNDQVVRVEFGEGSRPLVTFVVAEVSKLKLEVLRTKRGRGAEGEGLDFEVLVYSR